MFSCFKCVKNKKNGILDNVYVLDYSHQSLQDVPPEIFDYERTLTELNLGANRIIDLPPQLFLCHELKILCLNSNDIAQIPSALGSLTELTFLDLYRNNLSFNSIPDSIKQLKQLRYLNLSVNGIDKLPDSVTCLINLEELYLNDTSIEYLQANFGRLVNLKILELRDNRLLTLTKSMSRLVNLQRLDLGHNKLQQFPLVICSFENLAELILDENMLEYLPDFISNLKKLTYFDCSDNELIRIPNEIKYLARMQDINLSFNQLTEIPNDFANLVNLITLKLNNNQLTGICDSLFNEMKQLEELTLNDNFLAAIPSSIGRLRKLKFLTLDNNYIEYLPQEIGSCLSLSILSVRCNNLIEIPPDIGHLSNLKVLNIVSNNIRNLPISILNLSKLSALWISDNQSQPMVQLQKDHDGDFNYFLTCYMFPQCKVNRDTDFISPSTSEDDILSSRYHLDNEPEKVHVESKRRICFAGETTIPNDRPGRLLRSPTPYPKDLRIMAKSLSDNQNKSLNSTSSLSYRQTQMLTSPTSSTDDQLIFDDPANPLHLSTQEPIQIKEAKIANKNTITTTQSNDMPNEMTTLLPPANIHPNNYSIHNALEITKNMYIAPPNIDEFDSASSYCHSQMDLAMTPKGQPGDYDDMLSLNSSVSQDMIMMAKRRMYDNYVYDSQIVRQPFDQQQPLPAPPLPHYHQDLPLPPLPPPAQLHQSPQLYHHPASPIHQPFSINNNNQGPRLPPPYHIAKNYSKISPQHLSIYETVRNRGQNGNIYENTKDLQESMNRMQLTNQLNLNGSYQPIMPNGNNMETIGEESLNDSSTLDENLNNEVEKLTDTVDGANRICYINTDGNDNCGSDGSSGTMSSLSMESQKSITPSSPPPTPPPLPVIVTGTTPKKSPTKTWLFGLHKNPTVIQFSIRRNATSAGFTIMEVPSMGIYINEIEINCDAFEKLHKMDKILDIDGYDFTKDITIEEATDILLNSGNIINIMISRK